MEDREYEMLVWGLQGEAQDRPEAFRVKVILMSLMAYLVLFAMLALLLLGLLFMFVLAHGPMIFKLMFLASIAVVLPILWLTFRMFLMPFPPPEGREIKEADAPALFKMVADLQQRLQGAQIHHVLITHEFNAAIAQRPRFGLFGGYRNYLILGLPMLYAVSPEELLAVLSHEYGHLAGGHGKMTRWIYRQRITFDALYAHSAARRESNFVNGMLAGMLDLFAPYYNAYTFVLSRQNEYEADNVGREMVGAETMAQALTRFSLLADWLHGNFWPKLYAQITQHETPPIMPYAAMRKLLLITMDEWATRERLSEVWKEESGIHDTHPCLNERVTALGQYAVLPTVPRTTAADALFGKFAQELVREFDTEWWNGEKLKWQQYYRRATRSNGRIAELEKQPFDALSTSDAQELALLLVEFRSVSAAKEVLKALLDRPGERFPKPVYFYGRALLDEGSAKGLDYLEEAYRLSPSMGEDCARTGYQWLCEKQNQEAAEKWLNQLNAVHS